MLFTRLTSGAAGITPSPGLLASLLAASLALHSFFLQLLCQLEADLELEPQALAGLADALPKPGDSPREIDSILSLFHYSHVAQAPCPEHVDYTLTTVVPFPREPGLEVVEPGRNGVQCRKS
jgi:hypothetical protein